MKEGHAKGLAKL